MSRGPGRLQRGLIAAFQAEPDRRFTIEELAALVYPGEAFKRDHASAAVPGARWRPPAGVSRRGARKQRKNAQIDDRADAVCRRPGDHPGDGNG